MGLRALFEGQGLGQRYQREMENALDKSPALEQGSHLGVPSRPNLLAW